MKFHIMLFTIVILFCFLCGCSPRIDSNEFSETSSIVDVSSDCVSTNSSTLIESSVPLTSSSDCSSSNISPNSQTSSKSETVNQPSQETASSNSSAPSSNRPTVVQIADPETGISWDGKSPIIYTYPDGSTGTEPRPGATYEQVPGMINTVIDETPVEYDGKCSECGKTEGDGTNGTCLSYWTGGDHNCPNCGTHVEPRTCHTCN